MTQRTTPAWVLTAGELSLGAVTLTAWAGFSGVLAGNWVVPVVVMTVVAHLVTAACRRRGLSLPISAATTFIAGVVVVLWISLPEATIAGIPTTSTPGAVSDAVSSAWASLRTDVAPVTVQPGLLLVVGAVTFVGIFLADWAAFRLWATGEALVPAVTVFVFAILVGDNARPIATSSAFAAATATFLLLHHLIKSLTTERWMADRSPWPGRSLAIGASLVAVAVVAGTLAGPALPGANDPAVVNWATTTGGGGGQRITVSPLVDIRGRLVSQSDTLLFTVAATQPAYWRLTSLETFDGAIWKSTGSYRPASGPLDGDNRSTAASTTVTQRFDLASLSAVWLPAAWKPSAIDADTEVRWHRQSGTLMVGSEAETSDGLTYDITSEVPTLDPVALRAANGPLPNDIASTYLQLPANVSPAAQRVARGLVAGATNDYDRARILQDWFATEFSYDLSVPPGHDGDAIDAFLARRSGYCEQFAGTFAVMARSIGIPARVAVGFTPGETDPDDPNVLLVRGQHAHAWPEVWLNGFGWVAFEPTPGRGAPGAEAWTGRPALQSDGDQVAPPPTVAVAPDPTGSASDPGSTPTTVPSSADQNPVRPPGSDAAATGSTRWQPLLALVIGVAALWLLGVRVGVSVASRRRQSDRTALGRMNTAWWRVETILAAAGLGRVATETTGQFVHRVTTWHPDIGVELITVANGYQYATFGQISPLPDEVDATEQAAEAVCVAVSATLTWRQRVRRLVDPGRLRR